MKITTMKLEDIIPYENNPRRNEGAVEKVAASIKEFGWKQPIVVDTENVIIAGHTRLKAAEMLGLDEAPVVVADDLDEEQARAYRLADNKTAELADWDFDALDIELFDIDNIDMEQFGFNPSVVETDEGEADEVEPLPSEYLVIIECESEEEQKELRDKLSGEGYKCRG